jgi:hypothetical protein
MSEPLSTDEFNARLDRIREKLASGAPIAAGCAPPYVEQSRDVVSWLKRAGVGALHAETVVDHKLVPAGAAEWMRTRHLGANMILTGGVGVGKTMTAVCCLRHVFLSKDRMHPQFPGVLFITQRDLFSAVFNRDDALLARAGRVAALVIDDWGAAYTTEYPLTELEAIVSRRHADKLATIATMNEHPDDGMAHNTPRAYSRLTDKRRPPGIVVLNRDDLRQGAA